jgi:hypothetical protein
MRTDSAWRAIKQAETALVEARRTPGAPDVDLPDSPEREAELPDSLESDATEPDSPSPETPKHDAPDPTTPDSLEPDATEPDPPSPEAQEHDAPNTAEDTTLATPATPVLTIGRPADPRIAGLPGQVDLEEVWTGVCSGAFSALAASAGKPLEASARDQAAEAAAALTQAVRNCAVQLTDLVRSHARDRIRAAWDTPAHPGGVALAERVGAVSGNPESPSSTSTSPSAPLAQSLSPVAVWLGGIDTAVVEHGDAPGLALMTAVVGRCGLTAVAGAAALDCPGAEGFLVKIGGQAGAAIVGVAVEGLSAGLLMAARDVIDDAGRVLDEAMLAEDIGPMLGGHALRFAKEAE